MNEDEMLNEALVRDEPSVRRMNVGGELANGTKPGPPTSGPNAIEFRQWQVGPNDTFRPAGTTREKLPSGVYGFEDDQYGIYLKLIRTVSDSLTPLPDSSNDRVLGGMETFWATEHKYRTHGLLYKRGVLLWGPPGSGKTATLTLLSRKLIAADGIVVICDSPRTASIGLANLRRIEPARRLICVLEDIDEMILRFGEHDLLALLDGENQVDNIVMLATTNYPDRLGARIVNRPSRFDERIFVGMPSAAARRVYLAKIATSIPDHELDRWIQDTEGLSIAHLRELAAAVLCLDQPYKQVIARLRSMRQRPQEKSGFGDTPTGFQTARSGLA